MAVVSQVVAVGYRVEVSGWDSNQEFFVEKADLDWSDEFGKQVLLSHAVTPGTLLFLRLLHPMSLDRVHPVPYQADPREERENGQVRVTLLPAQPRARRD
ncbi:MAG TPA: hypothetical protein VLC94_06285 [Candidatus Acidoferrum sp.]|nr:hypothetical protein [Candidatus Acidoferrum sp.]